MKELSLTWYVAKLYRVSEAMAVGFIQWSGPKELRIFKNLFRAYKLDPRKMGKRKQRRIIGAARAGRG